MDSVFCKTGKFYYDGDSPNPEGEIFASIDGTGDSYPLVEVDNCSRVIKYVGILGYRATGYAMPEMRIHDINLVCDLNAHDPTVVNPCDVALDGTNDGSLTSDITETLDSDAYTIASQCITGEWGTEWWPTYYLSVFTTTAILLLTIALDILSNIELIYANIIDRFLNDFGMEFIEIEYLINTALSVTKTALFGVAVLTMEFMTAAMMLYSATQSIPALVIGVILWLTTAGLVHLVATYFAEELNDPNTAGVFWLLIAIEALCNLVGGAIIAGYTNSMRKLTKMLSGFIERLGGQVSWGGSRLKFGWAPKIALAALIAIGVYNWIEYGL